jgi:two-component system, LytTR family, sensor kinase
MESVKKYQLKTGIFISLFVSLLVFIPRAIRYDETEHFYILLQVAFNSFVFTLSSWLWSQFFLKTTWIKYHWQKALISISISMTVSVFFSQFAQDGPALVSIYHLPEQRRLLMLLFRGFVVGGFTYLCTYYLNVLMETQQATIEVEQLKQENLEARLNSLKQQISPHFLFNSLNTLKSVANEEHVKEYVVQLSLVYRYLLNYNKNNLATVKEELAFINAYSFILKERLEDGFRIEMKIDDEVKGLHIPPLSLQILIENAVKHNIATLSKPLRITITNTRENIIVSNNLQRKLSSEESTGKGLYNISDRYRLLAQQQIDIKEDGTNFTVKLPLLP